MEATGRALLEVTCLHARDVPGAVEGGADRIALIAPGPVCALSPEPAVVSAVVRAAGEVPVRVLLRTSTDTGVTAGESVRLIALAREFLALGAEGLCFGFLDADLEVDVDSCAAIADALPGVPWTFHRAIDSALDPRRAWRRLLTLAASTGLSAVRSAGSPQGMAHGHDELLARAGSDPRIAGLLMPGGGLAPEHVPWLRRTGVDQWHLGTQVRPGGTYRSYVDAGFVRSWRTLLDAGASGTTRTVRPA